MKKIANSNPSNSFTSIIARYNLVIFIVVVVVGLIAAILTLNYVLRLPFSNVYNPQTNGKVSFDQSTIVRIEKLQTSDNNQGDQTLPSGRINPFAE